jgi:hypothetical protein
MHYRGSACTSVSTTIIILLLVFPASPLPYISNNINQTQQDRHLYQRPHRRSQGLVAIRPIRRNGHGNRKFEVVARSREALRGRQLVAEAQLVSHRQGGEEDDGEIHDQGRGDAHHRHHLVHDVIALRSEQHDDSVQQADQRPGRHELDEDVVVPARAREAAQAEARDDGGAERDAEEGGDALGDGGVADVEGSLLAADDLDEEDGQGREEHHLQDRVDGHEDGAVLAVAAGEARPDEDLGGS